MNITDASEGANALVAAWIVRQYRKDGSNEHLRDCPDASVVVEGGDSTYGCDTGCDYLRLEAALTCPHGERDEYSYGDFGELSWILDDLEAGKEPS